jgi:hypothetical protein
MNCSRTLAVLACVRNRVLAVVAALACTAPQAALIYGSGRLEADVLGASCSTTSPDGTTTSVPCEPGGWSPTLEPGWSALMTATIGYSYADDGRRLDSPASIQVSHTGSVAASFESAVLYSVTSASRCSIFHGGDHCSIDSVPYDAYFDVAATYPLFLSNNDAVEAVSGEVEVTTGWLWQPPASFYGQGYTLTPTLSVDVWGIAHAVPEPSTWALMIGPLVGLGVFARRRRKLQR